MGNSIYYDNKKSVELYKNVKKLFNGDYNYIGKKYKSDFDKIVNDLMSETLRIKTRFGDYDVDLTTIMNKDTILLFIDFIILKAGYSEDLRVRDILSSKDIGIIICTDIDENTGSEVKRLYFNLDDDISSWICDRKQDDFFFPQ